MLPAVSLTTEISATSNIACENWSLSAFMGYEDLNDHDHLRRDPTHGLICGKSEPLGQDRILERDKGKALAGASTLNRLELSAQAIDARYQKIQAQPDQIEELLIQRGVKAIPRRSAEIVLDFDATDDPLHGSQEGAYFHGYCGDYFVSEKPAAQQSRDISWETRQRSSVLMLPRDIQNRHRL
jgi:hypothetical protein